MHRLYVLLAIHKYIIVTKPCHQSRANLTHLRFTLHALSALAEWPVPRCASGLVGRYIVCSPVSHCHGTCPIQCIIYYTQLYVPKYVTSVHYLLQHNLA